MNEELDLKASKFIDEKLPEFFGVKAAHHQAAVMKGRNPKSLPKDSELWMYSKISTRRKNLIERGRALWDVVDEVSLEKSHAEVMKRENRLRSPNKSHSDEQSEGDNREDEVNDIRRARKGSEVDGAPSRAASPAKHFGTTTSMHMTGQIKAVMQNKAAALDLRVNFKTKAPVAYGNTFLIVNYNDDVLYMHNISKEGETPIYELRTKPLSKVESADRVKFKALDLNNPSNPKAIRFGDNVWFQCVVDEDNTNLMAGFVMTSKIFEPPNLQSVRIDYRSVADDGNNSNNAAASSAGGSGDRTTNGTAPGRKGATGKKGRRRSVIGTTTSASSLPSLYESSASTSGDIGNRQQSAPSLSQTAGGATSTSSMLSKTSSSLSAGGEGPNNNNNNIAEELLHTTQTEKVAAALGILGRKEKDTEEEAKVSKLCGYVQVSRIADNPRIFEGQPPPENANALKNSMRYNTRQTMILGKWTFNDALRSDQHKDPDDKTKHRAGKIEMARGSRRQLETDDPSSNGSNIAALERTGVLTSLTPIVIQQDAYCLSFAQPSEITKWPLTSFDILKKNVKQRPQQMSSASPTNNSKGLTMSSTSSAVTSSSAAPFLPAMSGLQAGGMTRSRRALSPSFSSNMNIGSVGKDMSMSGNVIGVGSPSAHQNGATVSFTAANSSAQYVDELNARYIKHLEHMKKGGILPARLESVIIKEKAVGQEHADIDNDPHNDTGASSTGSSSQMHPSQHEDHSRQGSGSNYGILRRIVSRKAPYDFAVDRRCVWKLCIFEEFTDNFLELSSKEKHAKAVMETATMTLKISKMNREGANVHIPRDDSQDLPALCGGEQFPRTLREITFKTNQRAEQEYLRARRIREYKLSQYFAAMIPQVLQQEEDNVMPHRPGTSSTINSYSSSEGEFDDFIEDDDEDEDKRGKGGDGNNKNNRTVRKGTLKRTSSQLSISSSSSSIRRRRRRSSHRNRQKHRGRLSPKQELTRKATSLLFLTEAEQEALAKADLEETEGNDAAKEHHLVSDKMGKEDIELDDPSSIDTPGGKPMGGQTSSNSNSARVNKKSRYYDNGMHEVKESIHHAVRTMKSISAADLESSGDGLSGRVGTGGSVDPLVANLHLGNPRHKSLAVQDALVQAKSGSPRGILLTQARSAPGSNGGTPTVGAHRLSGATLSAGGAGAGAVQNVSTSSPMPSVPLLQPVSSSSLHQQYQVHHPPSQQQQQLLLQHGNHSSSHHHGNHQHQSPSHHRHHNHHHHHHHHQHHHHHKAGLSDEIRAVFNTKLKVPNKEEMVLTNTDKVQHFNDFSSGEQIMSLHRTMNFYNKLANFRAEQTLQMEKQTGAPSMSSAASLSSAVSAATHVASSTNVAVAAAANTGTGTGGEMMTHTRRQSAQNNHPNLLATAAMNSPNHGGNNSINTTRKLSSTMMGHHVSGLNNEMTMTMNTAGGTSATMASVVNASGGGSTSSSKKAVPISANVLAKLEKLQLEDANIASALNYKQAVERNPMNEIEHRNYSQS